MILPKIEVALEEMASQFPDEQLQSLTISEKPSRGRSEKIFHIYDSAKWKRYHSLSRSSGPYSFRRLLV